ncbi:hypothetical protein GCM10011583_28780 [Streptomyces camponoticapitis]|uniref:DUF5667 domain-containing protein n=1 Tax=Streptomyces camponoticapitis TaxID=1616125 RepID=A0ABQ2E554_9ACTN|nr:DUF5667 domain-containing protein [Streptomyces camponoticapitis]GGJ95404.1 hypothetical protein GCM10011583_28780 [Streptomyces camponoticapitis]
MIANVSAHRRANAFAQALEDRTPQGEAAEQPAASAEPTEQGRLLALATGLGELPRPTLDPEVKVVQRAQLVAAMEAMLLEGTAGGPASAGPAVPEQRRTSGRGAHRASRLRRFRPRSRWSKGLAAGGLTVGVAAGAFGGVAAASSDALPGDSLYGLKRGMEDFKLGLADEDADRGGLYLDHASTRLSEARRLLERGRSGVLDHESLGEIRRALNGMKHDATEGHRLLNQAYEKDGKIKSIATLSSFSASHRAIWDNVRHQLPPQLSDVGSQVNSVFDAIDEDVAPLQSLLPRTPDKDRRPQDPGGAAKESHGSGGGPDAGPSPSESAPDTGRTDDGGKPSPSGPGAPEDDGLLPASPGDLLNPPSGNDLPSAPGQGGLPPGPDITIPPLLPDLLPGLGIDTEDVD